MTHPQDQGRCLLDGHFECPAIVPEACICQKMPPRMALDLAKRKYGQEYPPDWKDGEEKDV